MELDRRQSGDPEPGPRLRVVSADNWPRSTHLADAADEEAYCSAWLALQCARIPGVTAGLVAIRRPHEMQLSTSAAWPESNRTTLELARLAERSYLERRTVVSMAPSGPKPDPASANLFVAVPLERGNESFAVAAVALATSEGTSSGPESVAEQLRWGAGWLEAMPWASRSKELSSSVERASACLDLLVTVGEQPRFQGMAIALTNELAGRLRCDRVSLGVMRRNGAVRVCALSHSAIFKNEGRLIDAIENAMEEAIDQRSAILYPPLSESDRAITIAHRGLTETIRTILGITGFSSSYR